MGGQEREAAHRMDKVEAAWTGLKRPKFHLIYVGRPAEPTSATLKADEN
jgi:hypothetical protein